MNLDEFRTASKHGPRCGIARILDAIEDPDDLSKLQEALARDWRTWDGIPHKGIADWLSRHGFEVQSGTVARHRKGECACG